MRRPVRGKPARRGAAVIGLGIMGGAMSGNLVKAGFAVAGYDPIARRRAQLKRSGGRPANDIAGAVRDAPFAITSLPAAAALLEVAAAIAGAGKPGLIVIETSTLPIEVKEKARDVLAACGIVLLDCPLSGTGAQARVRDLSVYASGPRSAVQRCAPVFEAFAREHFHLGPFGTGSKMKFLANLLVEGERVTLIDFDDCGFGWFMYDFAAAVSFHEDDPQAGEWRTRWLAGYEAVRPLVPADRAVLEAMVLLRRMALLAWIGSHHETELARAHADDFAARTARLAVKYLG